MSLPICIEIPEIPDPFNLTLPGGVQIEHINLFMGMIGGPEIPHLSDLAGRPLDDVIPPIDAIVDTLKNARDAVPVP